MAAVSAIDPLVTANQDFARTFAGGVPGVPGRRVAVVTCMDTRIDPLRVLGLVPGDAHIIRNAGGLVTDDALRSLVVSQRKLDTTAVMVIQHTRCGLGSYDDADFRNELEAETGRDVPWGPTAFGDQQDNVREAVRLVRSSPFLPHVDDVRGFVYDVDSGLLTEVSTSPEA